MGTEMQTRKVCSRRDRSLDAVLLAGHLAQLWIYDIAAQKGCSAKHQGKFRHVFACLLRPSLAFLYLREA